MYFLWHGINSVKKKTIFFKVLFQCPTSWIAFEGSCYKHFTHNKTWTNAKAVCNAKGAQLVKIEAADENDFIKKEFFANEGDFWIGLTDVETEGDWRWSDGCKLTGYTNWKAGQPNNIKKSQHCGAIKKEHFNNRTYDGEWHDNACYVRKQFICEMYRA